MRWSSRRSLRVTLAGLSLTALPWRAVPPVHGQETSPPAAPAPADDLAKRIEELARTINRHLDAGQIGEAIPPARETLELLERSRGKDHWQTENARRSLETYQRLAGQPREVQARYAKVRQARVRAYQLFDRGQYAEAALLFQEALSIRRDVLGEGHPDTARSYNTLALTLAAQGRHAEAEAMHRRALEIRLKALGEGHPDTAPSYNNLAVTLSDQGRHAEAEAMVRRALEIALKALGEDHPHTATSYNNLAWSLDRQGKLEEALRNWSSAAASHERARLRGTKGLESALTANESPLPAFALALARAGQPREAWTHWERGLARGLVEEVTGRAARPLTAEEHDREANLLGQSQAIDERIGKLLALKTLTQDQEKLLDDLKREGSDLRRQLLELEQQFESKYGASVGQPTTLEVAQKALPEGTALLGWVDVELPGVDAPSYHWACLLRLTGEPVWVRLPGSGEDGTWTEDERSLANRLRTELDPETTKGNARPLAEALARQRLEPLKGHLQGVKRLVVVNSPGLAGVPVEVLLAARPDPAWDGITVAYAPSAAMFAYVVGKPSLRDRAPTLLTLADPAYPEARPDSSLPPPPEAGLAIARVLPNGNADLNGLRNGDVLLTYAGTTLTKADDLKTVAPDAGPREVTVTYWREGITREVEVAAGPLGVAIDKRPAKEVVLARRAAEQVLLGMQGGSRERLPGTRREVEAITGLFPAEGVTSVLGERACESTVQDLARSGRMKGFRFLHFAAHGESDPRNAYRSALILAPDPDRPDDPLAFDTDGTITAEQIARTWELDADLVVLSGCETGLGRAAGGEGYLGFAQPLFAKGARSLVLSLWDVDDDATALLMTRFYQNLLGRRLGLTSPMPKAEALAEAKAWLRGAGPEDVGRALSTLTRGATVRREAVAPKLAHRSDEDPTSAPKRAARLYEDPTCWAGFILVGSPD